MTKISSSSFYSEYHGHKLRHLEALYPLLRAESDALLWTAGDSSLDNKYDIAHASVHPFRSHVRYSFFLYYSLQVLDQPRSAGGGSLRRRAEPPQERGRRRPLVELPVGRSIRRRESQGCEYHRRQRGRQRLRRWGEGTTRQSGEEVLGHQRGRGGHDAQRAHAQTATAGRVPPGQHIAGGRADRVRRRERHRALPRAMHRGLDGGTAVPALGVPVAGAFVRVRTGKFASSRFSSRWCPYEESISRVRFGAHHRHVFCILGR